MDIVAVPISKGFYSNQTEEERNLCINHMERKIKEWGLVPIHDFNDGESHHMRVYARLNKQYELDWNHGQILASLENGKKIEVHWYPDIFEPLRPAWKKAAAIMQRKIFPREVFINEEGILSFTGEVLATLAEFEGADKKNQTIFEDLHWFDIVLLQEGFYELKGKELEPRFLDEFYYQQCSLFYDVLYKKVNDFFYAMGVKMFASPTLNPECYEFDSTTDQDGNEIIIKAHHKDHAYWRDQMARPHLYIIKVQKEATRELLFMVEKPTIEEAIKEVGGFLKPTI
jgi:hypothetical protein